MRSVLVSEEPVPDFCRDRACRRTYTRAWAEDREGEDFLVFEAIKTRSPYGGEMDSMATLAQSWGAELPGVRKDGRVYTERTVKRVDEKDKPSVKKLLLHLLASFQHNNDEGHDHHHFVELDEDYGVLVMDIYLKDWERDEQRHLESIPFPGLFVPESPYHREKREGEAALRELIAELKEKEETCAT